MDTREQLLFAACLLPTLIVATAVIVSLVAPEPAGVGALSIQVAAVPDYSEILDVQ